ncbi:YidH family protein [Gordonia malaquae]|uniref:YidH family protein n=1 Tax=Gordonia malaquae TaxID=410332 RepID=UPI003BF7CF1A
MESRRFPQRVYGEGIEPDPRFSLANERTFLAWLRTSLAMFAAAFTLEALSLPTSPWWRLASASAFCLLGLMTCVQAWLGWMRTERALRRSAPLSGPSIGVLLVAGILVATTIASLGILL